MKYFIIQSHCFVILENDKSMLLALSTVNLKLTEKAIGLIVCPFGALDSVFGE